MFRTQSQYELKIPLPSQLYGENPGIHHWHAFECVLSDFWYIVEFLSEEGEGEYRSSYWKTICSYELAPVLQLVNEDFVLEHRINLVIPTYKTSNKQLQIKPLSEIYSYSANLPQSTKEFVTNDGERYVQSVDDEDDAKDKTRIYFKSNTNVRGEL